MSLLAKKLGDVGATDFGAVGVAEQYRHVDYDYEKLACLLSEAHNQSLEGDRFKTVALASKCGWFLSYDTYASLQWHERYRS